MDRDEDFDFVSDVLNHQFIIDVPEDAVQQAARSFKSKYDAYVSETASSDSAAGWDVAVALGELFRTSPESDAWECVMEQLPRSVKTVEGVELELASVRAPHDPALRNKLVRLIEVQVWMRMLAWEERNEETNHWRLFECATGSWPEKELEPRQSYQRLINDLRTLAQIGLNHKVVPDEQFPRWLANVMRVGSVTVDRDGGFDCIRDVLGHEYHIFDGHTSGKKDATADQSTPPANKNTSAKRITPRSTNDDNNIPTNDDSYVYSTPPLKKKKKKKKSKRNEPDLIGRDDSEVNAASSPLVRGSVSQSCRDQDSQACDDSSMARSSSYQAG